MAEEFDQRLQAALHARARQVQGRGDVVADVRHRARRQRRARQAVTSLTAVAALGLAAVLAGPQLLAPVEDPEVVLDPVEEPQVTPEGKDPDAEPDEPAVDERGPARETCEGGERGVSYRVRYPAAWWVADDGVADCRFFHPEPIEVPEATDATEFALLIRVADTPAEALLEDPTVEVLEQQETTVDGFPAVVQEVETVEDTLVPAGTRTYRYLVDLDGRTLRAATSDAAGMDYDRSRAVLDAVMADLEVDADTTDGP